MQSRLWQLAGIFYSRPHGHNLFFLRKEGYLYCNVKPKFMREFSLNKEPDLVVSARFIQKGKDGPLKGDRYVVRLYDRDIADDEYLGESHLDDEGRVRIAFSHDAFVNDVVFKEARPDFFFVIFDNDTPIYSTPVLEDLRLEDLQQLKIGEGEVVDLGTFLVSVH